MSLYKKIEADMRTAMKGRDVQTLEVLRPLLSSLKNKAIELKEELKDADVIGVIKSDARKIEDSIESFVAGGRQDLVDKAHKEMEILKKYLPPEMSDEDLEAAVEKVLNKLGKGDMAGMGKAIGAVMKELKEKADGRRVKEMVERLMKK